MKLKALVLGLLILIGGISTAMIMTKGSTKVPKAVKKAFTQKYPAAQKVDWEMEDEGEYEAEFKMNGNEMTACFKADGTWLETETEMDKEDLPEAVKVAISAQFPDFELEEAEKLEMPDTPITYEVKLENEKNDKEVEAVFTADGTLLKKKNKEEDEDEEDDDDNGGGNKRK